MQRLTAGDVETKSLEIISDNVAKLQSDLSQRVSVKESWILRS